MQGLTLGRNIIENNIMKVKKILHTLNLIHVSFMRDLQIFFETLTHLELGKLYQRM